MLTEGEAFNRVYYLCNVPPYFKATTKKGFEMTHNAMKRLYSLQVLKSVK